jgi:hypothetical protein
MIEFKRRGPKRLRPEDGSRVMSIKFRPKEYAKLKCVSLDTDKSIKALIFDAVKIAYGETSDAEMNRIYGVPALKVASKPTVDRIQESVQTWTFSADTVTPIRQPESITRPSVIPQISVKETSMKETSDLLWELLTKE